MAPIISTITSGLSFGRNPPTLSYEMSASSTLLDETGNRLTIFTVTTENVVAGTVLYYTMTGPGITDADFVSGQAFGSFTISNNSGTFQFETYGDYLTEGTEDITVSLRIGGFAGSVVATETVTVQDTSTSPTFTVTPSSSNVNENDSINFSIFTDLPVEQTVYYTFTGTINNEDVDVSSGIGSVQIGGLAGTTKIVTVGITSDYLTEGTESFAMQVRRLEPTGDIAVTSSIVTINDTSQDPTFQVSSPTSVNEGSSINFTITVSGSYRVGDTFYWTVDTSASSLDFSTPMSGSFIIPGSATNTVTITTIADQTTEGSETFNLSVRKESTSGTILATSNSVTINDTSQDPTYAIAGPASIDEYATGTINITTQYVFDATVLYWDLSNTTDFDTATSGSVTISSNAASFSVTPTGDRTTEGSETFTARLYSDSGRTNLLAESANITINDTSPDPSYSVTGPTSVDEGSTATFNISTIEVDNGTVVYWDVTNSGDFDGDTSGNAVISSSDGGRTGTSSFTTGTVTEDSSTEGAETFTASIYSDSGRTNLLATSSNVTINDTSVTSGYDVWFDYNAYGGTIGTLWCYIQYTGNSYLDGPLTVNWNGTDATSITGAKTNSSTWLTAKITGAAGDGKIYWVYRSGTSYTGDIAIDKIRIMSKGTSTELFEFSPLNSSAYQLQTTTNYPTTIHTPSSTFSLIAQSTSAGRWNYDSGGTPSSSTGPSNDSPNDSDAFYVYAETTSPGYSNKYFTLRMGYDMSYYLTL